MQLGEEDRELREIGELLRDLAGVLAKSSDRFEQPVLCVLDSVEALLERRDLN